MWLVLSGPAGGGVKGQEEAHGLIGIEKPELLPGFPELRMEPVPFRGIEMNFEFGEKVLVILHGLPVLDHRVHLLVVFALCVGHRRFITTRGAFGDRRIWSPNAPAHFWVYVNSFRKFYEFFLRSLEEEKKREPKKERKFGL